MRGMQNICLINPVLDKQKWRKHACQWRLCMVFIVQRMWPFCVKVRISEPGGTPLDQADTERTKQMFSFHVALICSKLAPRDVHRLCVDFV